jgi:hypothetical protein
MCIFQKTSGANDIDFKSLMEKGDLDGLVIIYIRNCLLKDENYYRAKEFLLSLCIENDENTIKLIDKYVNHYEELDEILIELKNKATIPLIKQIMYFYLQISDFYTESGDYCHPTVPLERYFECRKKVEFQHKQIDGMIRILLKNKDYRAIQVILIALSEKDDAPKFSRDDEELEKWLIEMGNNAKPFIDDIIKSEKINDYLFALIKATFELYRIDRNGFSYPIFNIGYSLIHRKAIMPSLGKDIEIPHLLRRCSESIYSPGEALREKIVSSLKNSNLMVSKRKNKNIFEFIPE